MQIKTGNDHHLLLNPSHSHGLGAVFKTNPWETLQKYLALVSPILIKNKYVDKNVGKKVRVR
jgi:hypothetical protein